MTVGYRSVSFRRLGLDFDPNWPERITPGNSWGKGVGGGGHLSLRFAQSEAGGLRRRGRRLVILGFQLDSIWIRQA
jgi:hypothetical protein